MGVVENDRQFFYPKTSQTAIGKAFDGVVTPSAAAQQSPVLSYLQAQQITIKENDPGKSLNCPSQP